MPNGQIHHRLKANELLFPTVEDIFWGKIQMLEREGLIFKLTYVAWSLGYSQVKDGR